MPTRAGLGTLSEERILELQKQATEPADGDMGAAMQAMLEDGLAFGPTLDGELLVQRTIDSIAAGVGADKPLVLGATDDEFAMAVADAKNKLRFVPKSMLLKKHGAVEAGRCAPTSARTATSCAAAPRRCSAATSPTGCSACSRCGSPTLRGAAPTWLYRFSWRSATFDAAVHCLDVPFFFDCLTGADDAAIDRIAGAEPAAGARRRAARRRRRLHHDGPGRAGRDSRMPRARPASTTPRRPWSTTATRACARCSRPDREAPWSACPPNGVRDRGALRPPCFSHD